MRGKKLLALAGTLCLGLLGWTLISWDGVEEPAKPRMLLTLAMVTTVTKESRPGTTNETLSGQLEGRASLAASRNAPEQLGKPGQALGALLAPGNKQGDAEAIATYREDLISSLKLHASYGQRGTKTNSRYFYRYSFQNVMLSGNEIQFFSPEGFGSPAPHWVDTLVLNSTGLTSSRPSLPTRLVVRAPNQRNSAIERQYIGINYSLAAGTPVMCKGWVDKPAFLVQATYTDNIFHTFTEGLMAAFQTLREQRALPLVQIDEEGNMREVTEGMGKSCPLLYDLGAHTRIPDANCPPSSGAVNATRCDRAKQPWCKPGVWSYDRDDGPLFLAIKRRSVESPWSHLLAAMTKDIRELPQLDGWCFRNLFIGATTTLDFYHATSSLPVHAERVAALGVFKAFVASAQEEWEQQNLGKEATKQYEGYKNWTRERLRRGIGPEEIGLAPSILPFKLPQGVAVNAEELHGLWREAMAVVLAKKMGKAANITEEEPGNAPPPVKEWMSKPSRMNKPSSRPVVTYMSRSSFSRGVLNEHELLQYILSRYNVTVRVTTLEEPLLEVIRLFRRTDVLIGMHGAGWTNSLFIKRGAAAVQLHPYGWRLENGTPIREYYEEMARASKCTYQQWFNPNPRHAFFREVDFHWQVRKKMFHLHPDPAEPHPIDWAAGAPWIYQNTYVDMESLGPVIDEAFRSVNIAPMQQPARHQSKEREHQLQ